MEYTHICIYIRGRCFFSPVNTFYKDQNCQQTYLRPFSPRKKNTDTEGKKTRTRKQKKIMDAIKEKKNGRIFSFFLLIYFEKYTPSYTHAIYLAYCQKNKCFRNPYCQYFDSIVSKYFKSRGRTLYVWNEMN